MNTELRVKLEEIFDKYELEMDFKLIEFNYRIIKLYERNELHTD
jgi:hypothetical protein